MQMTIYNANKCRLETVNAEMTESNTTWFEDTIEPDAVHVITDFDGGLLIKQDWYDYPIWIDGVSRDDVSHDRTRAKALLDEEVDC